jgi:hypothetical protein
VRSFEVRLSSRGRWGCDGQRWRLGALDDEPQHEGNLSEEGGLRVGIHLVLNLRQQYARKAEDHPGEAGESEPDAQEPRQESRPVQQQREGSRPTKEEEIFLSPQADAFAGANAEEKIGPRRSK